MGSQSSVETNPCACMRLTRSSILRRLSDSRPPMRFSSAASFLLLPLSMLSCGGKRRCGGFDKGVVARIYVLLGLERAGPAPLCLVEVAAQLEDVRSPKKSGTLWFALNVHSMYVELPRGYHRASMNPMWLHGSS